MSDIRSSSAELGEANTINFDSSDGEAHRLKGRIGLFELLCTVLAYCAPVAVVSGYVPFVIVFDGIGAPAVYALCAVLLLLFTVGFTTMTRYVAKPGAFYAYVTAGLGKSIGLGAAFLAIIGYFLASFSALPFFGINLKMLVADTLGGPNISWYWYALLSWGLCAVLSYLRIDLSAKVLTVAMSLEVIVVLLFDGAVFAHGGSAGVPFEPWTFHAASSGAIGVSMLFAVACFLGFEATAVFRDEVKDAKRTVPLASYIAVILIGVFYAMSAWALVAAFGVDHVVDIANKDPAGMFATAMTRYVSKAASDAARLLVVTSIFAAALSGQNIIARYLFNLGADKVLPAVLGKVHNKHQSPFVAAIVVSAVWLVMLIGIAASGADPAVTYGCVAGVGAFAIMILMTLTSVAVVIFFRRSSHVQDSTLWHTLIAPAIASVGLAAILVLAVKNFSLLIGGSDTLSEVMQALVWITFVSGVLLARLYKTTKPNVYARIGGQQI
ncbi:MULTISPECIES: APC family permease [Caballeronia]|uniref:APC family permease n=1 Tax=Caballeronia TaxID=1827195 RepID=UPI001FD4F518|nr:MULTISPECIES: APC family permease [Caballeronia]MDR5799105.1 APC family permease [Caballeronia sp. LZ001]